MIKEISYGYLAKRAKTLKTLEFFPENIDPQDLKEGKRYHEDIVKVTVIVEKAVNLYRKHSK